VALYRRGLDLRFNAPLTTVEQLGASDDAAFARCPSRGRHWRVMGWVKRNGTVESVSRSGALPAACRHESGHPCAQQEQRRGLWDGNGGTPSNVVESEGSRRNIVESDLDAVECECALDSRESAPKERVRRRGVGTRPDRCGAIEERDDRPVEKGTGSQWEQGVPISEGIDQRRKRHGQHPGVFPEIGHDRRLVDVVRRVRPDADGHAAVPQTVLEEDSIDGPTVDFCSQRQTRERRECRTRTECTDPDWDRRRRRPRYRNQRPHGNERRREPES